MCPLLTFLILQAGKNEKVNEGISNTSVLAVQVSPFSVCFICIEVEAMLQNFQAKKDAMSS